ncbi:MAG: 5-formyltetrahydrofolate cyclo-ligase [Treponema sp.]|nr:5-formyltetrahydrofolate cyclo-ligase [Treponema sp.]
MSIKVNTSADKDIALAQRKKQLRHDCRNRLATLCKQQPLFAHDAGRQAVEQLRSTRFYTSCHAVFAFVSYGNEIDTRPLLDAVLADGKQLLLPRIIPDTNKMDFYAIDAAVPLDNQLETGSFGIKEPKVTLEKVVMSDFPCNALFIVPGLAFTVQGNRLGKGKGFYDRYIATVKNEVASDRQPVASVGMGFEAQVVTDIPCDVLDIPLTHLVTEESFYTCHQ